MKKLTQTAILLCTVIFCSCQTLEWTSIDYLVPANISFPKELRRVGVVNNVGEIPDDILLHISKDTAQWAVEVTRNIKLLPGDPFLTTESLAEALADENYFDMVVICDSALRENDKHPRESMLSRTEVEELAQELNVDLIMALESIMIKTTRTSQFIPEWRTYLGTVDAQIYPTIRLYLPNRNSPMATLAFSDSIFWEKTSPYQAHLQARLISDKEIIEEASIFAGTIPIKQFIPYWESSNRYFYSGGSIDMRDAAVYVRENAWDKAFELWEKEYQNKKEKKQMRAAFNIALYYEIKDDFENAELWLSKAFELAKKIEKVANENLFISTVDVDKAPNYRLMAYYLYELEKRKAYSVKLNMQMDRFNEEY